ncbi:nuclear transport factor 2 family protein [Parasphingorhabdus sp. JC815]|uniref:nuclear transport factor 2 family protein n=1 Tax=Parasphingorhabdus sp. JC815 TaxID=3232140 RepID=UPI00345A8F73
MGQFDFNRLRRLEDAEAIRNLIASYGPLADSGDASAVAALWTGDGSYSVGDFGVAKGRQAITALIESDMHQNLMKQGCGHILTSPHIILGNDSAIATNHSIVFRHVDDRYETWRVSANRWQLVHTDDGWRVGHRDNRPLSGDERARALLSL